MHFTLVFLVLHEHSHNFKREEYTSNSVFISFAGFFISELDTKRRIMALMGFVWMVAFVFVLGAVGEPVRQRRELDGHGLNPGPPPVTVPTELEIKTDNTSLSHQMDRFSEEIRGEWQMVPESVFFDGKKFPLERILRVNRLTVPLLRFEQTDPRRYDVTMQVFSDIWFTVETYDDEWKVSHQGSTIPVGGARKSELIEFELKLAELLKTPDVAIVSERNTLVIQRGDDQVAFTRRTVDRFNRPVNI